jgi:hypothetical protein
MSNMNWLNKLHISYQEDPDGSGTITIEWDEEDCSLEEWTSWGEDKQKQFILDALTIAVSNALDNDET